MLRGRGECITQSFGGIEKCGQAHRTAEKEMWGQRLDYLSQRAVDASGRWAVWGWTLGRLWGSKDLARKMGSIKVRVNGNEAQGARIQKRSFQCDVY